MSHSFRFTFPGAVAVTMIVSAACGGGGPAGPGDGGNPIATGPYPTSLQTSGGKLFWSEAGDYVVRVITPGAASSTGLVPKVGIPSGLTLSGGQMYWLDIQTGFAPSGCAGTAVIRVLHRTTLTSPGRSVVMEKGDGCAGGSTDVLNDGTYTYWVTSTSSPNIYTLRKSSVTGPSTPIASSATLPIVALQRDAGYLYWLESDFPDSNGAIRRVPLAGGSVETIASGIRTRTPSLALNSTAVFYTQALFPTGDVVMRAPIAGGGAAAGDTIPATPTKLLADDAALYWIDSAAAYALPLGGGSPSVLASSPHRPHDLQFRGTDLLWSESTGPATGETGAIWSVPKSGGGRVLVHDGGDAPFQLLVDASYLYWTEGGRIARMPSGGGQVETVASGVETDSPPTALSADYIYIADQWRIKRVPQAGGLVETVAALSDKVMCLATDGSFVYWLQAPFETAFKTPVGGGAPTQLATTPGQLASPDCLIRVQGTQVFWAPNFQAILSVATTGGAVRTVTTQLNDLSDFLTDGSDLVFADGGAGIIARIPNGGGAAETIAFPTPRSYVSLAQDASNIYWIDQANVGRVAKSGGQVTYINPNQLAADPFFPARIAVDGSRVYWTLPPVQLIQFVGK